MGQEPRRPALDGSSTPSATKRSSIRAASIQILKRHFARYTPELVEQVCGTPKDRFLRVADALRRASGPEKTGAICYAVGWTQHSTGVQIIRAAAILQLLLGNIGRPGGGIMALRGHASIQGSTDIPTLYDILPGYLPMPNFESGTHTLHDYIEQNGDEDRLVAQHRQVHRQPAQGVVRRRGDRGERLRLRLAAADHRRPLASGLLARHGRRQAWKACSSWARTRPSADRTRGSSGARWRSSNWLVVRDLVEIETASFWYDSPEVERGELRTGGHRDRSLPDAGGGPRREGRLLHEHAAAAAVAREGGRSAGRRAQRDLVHLSPRAAAEGEGRARSAAAQRRA